jgi:hypothetical protein
MSYALNNASYQINVLLQFTARTVHVPKQANIKKNKSSPKDQFQGLTVYSTIEFSELHY